MLDVVTLSSRRTEELSGLPRRTRGALHGSPSGKKRRRWPTLKTAGRLWKKAADSFQKRPTLETAGRLWKETADSGNTACVWLPEWNDSAALFTAFRNAFSSLWGLPRSETGPVFTAFRNAFSCVWGLPCKETGPVFTAF